MSVNTQNYSRHYPRRHVDQASLQKQHSKKLISGNENNRHGSENPEVDDYGEANDVSADPSKLAAFLRIAGAAAVVLSAIIYMLQGIENIDMQLRHWTYLILMGTMAFGGYVCRYKLTDALGARLFFSLAVLLVPVQFSQLGGMIHAIFYHETSNALSHVWTFSQVNMLTVAISFAISIVLASMLSLTSFSILARHKVKSIAATFILLNTALLLPERVSLTGLLIIGGMLASIVALNARIFSKQSIFKTREGLVLRFIVALPVVVAVSRTAFYIDVITGVCVISLIAAFLVTYLVPAWVLAIDREHKFPPAREQSIREVSLFIGVLMSGFTWMVLALKSFYWTGSYWTNSYWAIMQIISLTALMPLIGLLFFAHRQTHHYAALYRNLACIASLLLGTLLIRSEPAATGACVTLILAVLMGCWGVGLREKFPLIVAMLLGCAGIVALIILSLANVAINIWLALAVAGIVLVFASSIIERHGRHVVKQTLTFWSQC